MYHYQIASAASTIEGTAEELTKTAQESIDIFQKFTNALLDKAQVIIAALVILIVGWYLCNFICKLVRHSMERSKLDPSATSFINSLVKFVLRIILAIIVVTKLGVDTTSIIALITSASLAVGLALQGSLANFAGGVLILLMKPFKIGDYINDGCGHEGTVTSIEIIYTRLTTADNQAICIPNGTLANSSITNVSHQPTRRIDFEVGVDYNEDIDRVRNVLLKTAENSQYVLKDPEAQVYVSRFDSSSVSIALRIWCEGDNYWPTKFELQEAIKKSFDQAAIEIPYDHMDVNILNK